MGKYNPDILVVLASLYESRANRLYSLAQPISEGRAHQFSVSSMATSIRHITGINATLEEWARWLEINNTVVADYINHYWRYDVAKRAARTHLEYLPFDREREAYISEGGISMPETSMLESAHLLKGVGTIPNLRLEIYNSSERTSAIVPPQLAHEDWLIQVFKRFYDLGFHEDELQGIAKFVAGNQAVISKIRSYFQKSIPEYLGGGVDGMAFSIGGGRVLKIFKDRASFLKARKAIESLHATPQLAKTEAMIYDIGEFVPVEVDGIPRRLYYYIIEEMRPVRSTEVYESIDIIRADISEDLQIWDEDKWKYWRDLVKDPQQHAKVRAMLDENATRLAKKIRRDDAFHVAEIETSDLNLNPNWLESFIEEIMVKHLTYRTDLHMGNLGVTGYGQLKYFDPTYGRTGSEVLPEL